MPQDKVNTKNLKHTIISHGREWSERATCGEMANG